MTNRANYILLIVKVIFEIPYIWINQFYTNGRGTFYTVPNSDQTCFIFWAATLGFFWGATWFPLATILFFGTDGPTTLITWPLRNIAEFISFTRTTSLLNLNPTICEFCMRGGVAFSRGEIARSCFYLWNVILIIAQIQKN